MAAHHMLFTVDDEPALHPGFLAGRADLVLPGSLTPQQSERSEEQGLAGPGLPGDHHESGPWLEARLRDQPEIVDDELVKHDRGRTGASPPQGRGGPRG